MTVVFSFHKGFGSSYCINQFLNRSLLRKTILPPHAILKNFEHSITADVFPVQDYPLFIQLMDRNEVLILLF